jgi:hypothetical protein
LLALNLRGAHHGIRCQRIGRPNYLGDCAASTRRQCWWGNHADGQLLGTATYSRCRPLRSWELPAACRKAGQAARRATPVQ